MSFHGVTFQPLSYEQANPFGSGMMQGSQVASSLFQNQMKNLQAQQLKQQIPYAGQQAAAQVGLTGAQANEANSLGGLYQANANLTSQLTPYKVQNAQATVYPDPILQRANQIHMITGKPLPQVLSEMGLSSGNQQPSQMPAPQQYQQQPTPQQQNPNQQWGGVPFLTPDQQRMRMMQQAQSYPVIPGNVPDLRQMQQMPGMQITPQNAPQLFAGNQQQPQQPQQQDPQQQQQQLQQQLQQPQQLQPSQGYGNAGQQLTPMSAPKIFNGTPMQNWGLFGTPYNPIDYAQAVEGAKTQGSSGVTLYNDAQKQAASDADDATQMQNYLRDFKENYGKSTYVGPRLGTTPTKGWLTPPGDMTPEINAENAANNMQQLVLKLMHTNKMTNYELNFAGNLKLNRAMTPGNIQNIGDFLNAKTQRINEQQAFLNAARNQNVDVQTAQNLWRTYDSQRPVYDFTNHTVNKNYQGTWRDFLKPQAIQAAQTGQPYVSVPSFSNKQGFQTWYNNLDNGTQQQVKASLARGG